MSRLGHNRRRLEDMLSGVAPVELELLERVGLRGAARVYAAASAAVGSTQAEVIAEGLGAARRKSAQAELERCTCAVLADKVRRAFGGHAASCSGDRGTCEKCAGLVALHELLGLTVSGEQPNSPE